MRKRAPRVDAYIARAPEFAQPILEKLRSNIHKLGPQLEENIKWGAPTFEYKGIVAGMAAFKEHVGFGFMKSPIMKDPHGILRDNACASIMHLNIRKLSEVPSQRVLRPYLTEAIALNEQGISVPRKKDTPENSKLPAPFVAALKKNKRAKETFDKFSLGKRREYIEWITDAKRESTRDQRIASAVEWISEGKPRNWKYMKKW